MEIQAANGKRVLALKVFSHALRFFKEHCLQELSDQSSTRIVNEDIRWVITVPAIWRQPAKQFMRQAAYEVRVHYPFFTYLAQEVLSVLSLLFTWLEKPSKLIMIMISYQIR